MYWVTYEGQRLKISEMSDTHIANVINWLSNNRPEMTKYIETFKNEAKRRNLSETFLSSTPYPHVNLKGVKVLELDYFGNPIT